MNAIDWPGLARGALWIIGLSCSLAAFSHMRWTAQRMGVPLRSALGWDSFLAPFFGGLVLFAFGMAWGAAELWEIAAWLILAALLVWQVVASICNFRRESREGE
jgi:hypothetical protein